MKNIFIFLCTCVFFSCTDDVGSIDSATEGSSSTTENPSPTTDPELPTTTNQPSTGEATTGEMGSTTASTGSVEELCTANTVEYHAGGGSGEEWDPYRICTVEQLKDLSDHIKEANSKHFILIKDLDFNDYYAKGYSSFVIGNNKNGGNVETVFQGSLNGGWYTIRNYSYDDANETDIALFDDVRNARFENLNLENFTIRARSRVAALAVSCGSCRFKNITASRIHLETKAGSLGGLVVSILGGIFENIKMTSLKLTFALEINENGEPFASSGVGGIAGTTYLTGFATAVEPMIVRNVHVEQGEITELGSIPDPRSHYVGQVGGLFGSTNTNDPTKPSQLINSTAEVSFSINSKLQDIGGLIGVCQNTVIESPQISSLTKNTFNYQGNIQAPKAENVGGIVGFLSGCQLNTVTADASIQASQEVGGLVGVSALYSQLKLVPQQIINSHSVGTVLLGEGSFNSVGGLIGVMNNGFEVLRSWSQVDIKGYGQAIGGLVGSARGQSVIEDSYSLGNIEHPALMSEPPLSSRYVGGIVGHLLVGNNGENSTATIRRVYSAGLVQGTQDVGGLVGGVPVLSADKLPIGISDSLSVALVQSADPVNAAGITPRKTDHMKVQNLHWWSKNPTSTEQECFEQFALPMCETENKDNFYPKTHPVYANWDFEQVWQANAGALPTLK